MEYDPTQIDNIV